MLKVGCAALVVTVQRAPHAQVADPSMQVPRTPGMQTAAKKAAGKKSRVTLPDLPTRKEPKGGGSAMLRNDPPLPIPPPGFIVNSNGEKAENER